MGVDFLLLHGTAWRLISPGEQAVELQSLLEHEDEGDSDEDEDQDEEEGNGKASETATTAASTSVATATTAAAAPPRRVVVKPGSAPKRVVTTSV